MSLKTLTLVLSVSTLATSVAQATQTTNEQEKQITLHKSDYYNGKYDENKLKEYQEKMLNAPLNTIPGRFDTSWMEDGIVLHQLQNQASKLFLEEKLSAEIYKDLIGVLKKKYVQTEFQRSLAFAAKGKKVDRRTDMKDPPPVTGAHLALIRKAEELTVNNINKILQEKEADPANKEKWEKDVKASQKVLEDITLSYKEIEKKKLKAQNDSKLKILDMQNQSLNLVAQIRNHEKEKEDWAPKKDLKNKNILELQAKLTEQNALPTEIDVDRAMMNLKKDLEVIIKEIDKLENTCNELRTKNACLGMSMEEENKSLEKTLKSLDEEISKNKVSAEKEAKAISNLQDKIKALPEKEEKLTNELHLFIAKRDLYQKAGDLYALIKYFDLDNIMRSPLFNEDDGHSMHVISPELIPFLNLVINDRGATIGFDNLKWGIARETNKYKSTINDKMYMLSQKIDTDLNVTICCTKTYKNDYPTDADKKDGFFEGFNKSRDLIKGLIKKEVTSDTIEAAYNTDNKDKHVYWPCKREFTTNLNTGYDKWKPSEILRMRMTKWLKKVSTDHFGALVNLYGLKSAMFNKDLKSGTPLSYQWFSNNFLEESLKDNKEEVALDKEVWSFGKMQLKINYSDSFIKKESIVINRITPIYQFIEKMEKQEEDLDLKEFDKLLQGNLFAETDLDKDIAEKLNKEAAGRLALLNVMAYMSMTYALTHDHEGKNLPEFKLIDPLLEANLKDPIKFSLVNQMAAKTYEWKNLLLTKCPDFVKNHALASYFSGAY